MRKRIIQSALSVILTAAIVVGSFASVAAQATTETTEPFTAVTEKMPTDEPLESQAVNEEQQEETVEPQYAEPVGAETEEEVGATYTSGYYEYSVNSKNEATITKYTGSASSVSIPSSLGGYTVKTIGSSAFKDDTTLKSVYIPNTVTEITGDSISGGAFRNCTLLSNVTIPGCVKSIGENTFKGCTSLSAVTIENGVETIRSDAFRNCESLTSVFIPKSVKNLGSNVFQDCKKIKTVIIDGGLNLDSNFTAYKAFYKCTALETVAINAGVTYIGAVMFQDCTSLTSVSIPNTVEEIKGDGIGGGAFQNCTSLTTVNIPGSVKTIGYNAFDGCTNLTKVTIGNGVETIESKAFYNCENLSSAIIPDNVKTIKSGAFYGCKSMGSLSIGKSVEIIERAAFEYCESLTSVTLPSSLTELGSRAFANCTVLQTITISSGTTKIGTQAFDTCKNLTSITIPESVSQIGNAKLNGSDLKDSGVFYNHSPSLVIYGKTGSFAESFANANGISFNKPQGGTSSLANERLTIYQKVNGEYKAAESAKVEYSGKSYTSDSNGVVAVPTISSGSIKVSKTNYITRTITAEQLEASKNIYLEPVNGNAPVVLAVWIGTTDVLHDSYPLEMTSTETTKITAEINWGNYSYGSIKLSQDGKTASFSGNTLSMVISNKFDTSKTITLIATDSQNHKTEAKLLIENGTVNNTLKNLNGAGFSLDSLSLTLPSDWPFIGGMSLGAGISSIIPVTISADNGKLYIAIGADIGSESNTDSYATDKGNGYRAHVLSKETKTFIQKFKETGVLNSGSAATAAKKLKNFTQTYKDAIKRPQGKFGVEADFTVIGFLEGSYDENGTITWIDTGVIVNPSVSVQHSFPVVLGPVPAFFEVGLSANVLGQLNIRLNEQAKNFIPNGEISGSLSVNGGIGLGVKNVLYVAGGLEGSLCPDWKIRFHEKDSLSIKAKLDAYAKLGVAFFEFKNSWTLAETTVYDSSSKSGNSVGALLDDYDIYDYSNYTAKDLSYLDDHSKVDEPVGAVAEDSVGATQLKNNIYKESTPQLVTFSNGTKLAVWVDSESSNINGTCLYYSYYNGSSWSTPAKVYNDGTLDYAPQMVEANGKAYLVWQNATRTFSGSETLENIAKDFDIAVSVFNGSSFSTTKLSNSNLDMQPAIYAEGNNAYVAWVNNSKNDWFGNNSNNSIYTSTYNGTWSQPQVKYSGLKSIGGLAIDYRNGIRVAYTVDTDGNIQTTDDLRVYENGSRVSANVQSFSPQYYQHKLYWYSGNTVVFSGSSNTGAIPSDRYQLVNANGTMAAVFTQSEGLYSKVCVSYFNTETNTWGAPKTLADNHSAIGAFSASVNKNGTIEVLINNCSVTGTYSSDNPYGTSSLLLFADSNSCDIAITDLFYDEKSISITDKKEFDVEIANNGSSVVKGIDITITDDKGTVLSSSTVSEMLVPGNTFITSVSYDSKGKTSTSKLTIKAVPRNSSDSAMSNNTKTITLVNDNVCVENVTSAVKANGKVSISADIVNYGNRNSNSLTVRLRKGSADGSVVSTKTVSSINSMDMKTVSFEINEKSRSIYFVCIEGNVDSYSADNSDYILINSRNVIGDVDGSGKVDATDRAKITRYVAKWKNSENDFDTTAADVNKDGKVNALDRIIITRYVAKCKGYESLPIVY